MKRIIFLLITTGFLLAGCTRETKKAEIEQWNVYEIVLNGPSSGNPYMDIDIAAVFTNNEKSLKVPGFYDGNGVYRIRFSPPIQGIWTYKTESNSKKLANRKGGFQCVPPTGNNHGPVKIVNTFYLEYTDGTPFYSIGTTAYQWTSVKQSIQEKTIETLAHAPFTKIRMCVFPKSYKYGNNTEPWAYPFWRKDTINDFTKPNFEFFQNFDNRVKQLKEMGIQADVILFHPYDKWGYSKMGKEMNEKYVRYMIARISAFSNIWWSLANEWDVPSIKESIDWEGIGKLLQNEDPHQRFRGIHNWYGSEDHFYDHTKPWLTHVSTQTSQFYNSIKWRNKYQKPLIYDEMRYEGDVESSWGRLSGQEMTSYFWMAGLSGGYPMHGDTFRNSADDSTEVRWWAKGGVLVGESPKRIQFFKTIMEQAPVKEMMPQLIDNNKAGEINNKYIPGILNNFVFIFSKPGEYYLAYTANKDKSIEINLPEVNKYKMEVIDTWNMKVAEEKIIDHGSVKYHTVFPYTAIRIILIRQ
jgi:hypothetical protein